MGQKYTNISDLYKQVKLNEQDIKERKLTPQELEDREKIAKKLPMADFKKRYGKDAMAVKMATATNIVKKKSQEEETELDENIPKSTMYALVKDGKVVAKGSKRDMTSKMKKEGGKIFNAPSKKVGDTMKESLDEKFTKKDFAKNEDENQHTKNAIQLVKMFGTSAEDIKVNAIAARHNMKGSISRKDQQDRDALIKKYYPRLKEEVINEDGHQDVASAIRQCKTITEDAMQILQKLQTMSPEDALPTWWTNKLAVASNSMNKIRDYLLVPSVSEAAGDLNDMKKLVGELQNASKMHLAQSKRVQAHVDMMTRANAKGPEGAGGLQDLKKIVGELEKASQAHLRQSKSIDAHVDFMGESLDEAMKYNFMVLDPDGRVLGMASNERQANDIAKNNLRKVRGRVVKLRKPMAQTRGDRLIGMLPADNLAEEMKPEDSLSKWKHDDAKGYAEKLIKEYGQPDEVTETMLKWNSLGSFGKGERETYIIDESIPHAFPKPHRDYVYTVMNIKVPSDMLDTLGHVTGSIIYDGLKEEVTARCGSLYANAATLGFVRDMVEGKVTTDKDGAKKEYADRITKDPLPKTYDNKMNEDVSYMCGAECVQESYQEMIARIMSQGEMR